MHKLDPVEIGFYAFGSIVLSFGIGATFGEGWGGITFGVLILAFVFLPKEQ